MYLAVWSVVQWSDDGTRQSILPGELLSLSSTVKRSIPTTNQGSHHDIHEVLHGLALAATSAVAADGIRGSRRCSVERNATDGDTEVVISGTAGDEGLRRLYIKSPARERMTTLLADDATPGMREFHFETPEPPGEAVLALSIQKGRTCFAAYQPRARDSGASCLCRTISHRSDHSSSGGRCRRCPHGRGWSFAGRLRPTSSSSCSRSRTISRSRAGVDRESAAACDELPGAAGWCGSGGGSGRRSHGRGQRQHRRGGVDFHDNEVTRRDLGDVRLSDRG